MFRRTEGRADRKGMASGASAFDLGRQGAEASLGLPELLLSADRLSASLLAGAHGRARPGSGETFWQYRHYTTSDAASRIDWRQSARSPSRYFVRETEWETAATVRIWCGGGASLDYASNGLPSKGWRARVLGVALAQLAARAGERIGDLPASVPARSGRAGVTRLAEGLFGQERDDDDLPMPPPGTAHAVYIDDFYRDPDALAAAVRALGTSGTRAHLVAVSDPAEEVFPFTGHVRFDPARGGGKSHHFGDAATVAGAYRKERDTHFAALADACARYGVTFLRHRTDHPAAPTLSALHMALGAHRR